MSTIAKAEKANHEIHAKLVTDKDGQHAVPDIPPIMKLGETVHYSSVDAAGNDAGVVTIEFRENGSPFLDLNGNVKTVITSNEPPIKLSKRGIFTCRCFITPPGAAAAAAIGWRLGDPLSGGNHDVQ
jgi:hypothetical protein